MPSRPWITLFLSAMLLAMPTVGTAAEDGESEGDEHANELALFLGATDEKGEDPAFSVGLEYGRLIAPKFAIGGLLEYAAGDLREWVVGVPVFFYPGGHWKLLAAPGVEITTSSNGGDDQSDEEGSSDDETNFLFRIGVGYGIELGKHVGIEPAVEVDFVDGDQVLVYGINLTYAW